MIFLSSIEQGCSYVREKHTSPIYVPQFKGCYIRQLEELKREFEPWLKHRFGCCGQIVYNEEYQRQRFLMDILLEHRSFLPYGCFENMKIAIEELGDYLSVTSMKQFDNPNKLGMIEYRWHLDYRCQPDQSFLVTYVVRQANETDISDVLVMSGPEIENLGRWNNYH